MVQWGDKRLYFKSRDRGRSIGSGDLPKRLVLYPGELPCNSLWFIYCFARGVPHRRTVGDCRPNYRRIDLTRGAEASPPCRRCCEVEGSLVRRHLSLNSFQVPAPFEL